VSLVLLDVNPNHTDGLLGPHFPAAHVDKLVELGLDQKKLEDTDVDTYVDMYVKK